MGLGDVVAVEKAHLAAGLDPYLVASVLREVVQTCHVKLELFGLRELAKASASCHKLLG
jgi:hypothetical protein